MQHRRRPVLAGGFCVVVIAAWASLPCTWLFAQQADKSQLSVPVQAVPASTQTTIDQLQAILNKADADGDGPRQVAALLAIGELYWMTGDSQTAMEKFSRALTIVRSLGLKPGEAMVLTDMGGACRDASKELKALEYDNQALAMFEEQADRASEALELNNLGRLYHDMG
jgi:tetratricopeptide (TPR) repeat protein